MTGAVVWRRAGESARAGGPAHAAARVRAVLRIGARIADAGDVLGREARERLPAVTGLSKEGVELALSRHLETGAPEEELAAFVGRAAHGAGVGGARRCHVVLSANVCTAALRAIAFGAATAPFVMVKPSRRDPVVADLLVRGLTEDGAFAAAGGAVARVGSLAMDGELAPRAGDEVHVYGSDATIAAVRGALAEGVTLRGHGTGFGVAVIEAAAEIEAAARDLAADVVPFDQRGCLSPRVALVAGGAERAEAFARALASALSDAHRAVPRGALDGGARAELRRYASTVQAVGACFEGDGFLVGLDDVRAALVLPPAARVVHVVPADAEAAARLLAPWSRFVAAIGCAGDGEVIDAVGAICPRARRSPLSFMQRPAFDGPVDLRAC